MNFNSAPGVSKIPNSDSKWDKAVIAEREKDNTHYHVVDFPVDEFLPEIQRNSCLVLGDASHMVTSALVEIKHFKHGTAVDSNHLVMDDFRMPKEDSRYIKILSSFEKYVPEPESFDFIYGKSVAYISKNDLESFLKRMRTALKKDGLFCAVFAGEGDSWRPTFYTREEIESLFVRCGFLLINYQARKRDSVGLTGDKGTSHELSVLAKRDDTDSHVFTFLEKN